MDRLLEGLDPEQRAAVEAPRGPVCVLAGAGTGKTRTITHRIAHLVARGHVAAGQVLAVTFTARAAGEMRTRLRALGVPGAQARTFHAAALRQLRYFWPRVVGGDQWRLVDGNKLRMVAQAAHRAGLSTESDSLRDLASEIEWAKASLIAPDDYPAAAARAQRDTPAPAPQVVRVYQGYERIKNEAQLLDFDDLLLHTAAALEEHGGVAEEFRDRYRCFVVDEYQDVTPLQQRVLDAWLGQRDDLTVVGDANQTIYSFAGASPLPLLNFARRFPEATVVRLERDYRSTPQVVALANDVIKWARGRPAGSRLKLIGQRPDGPDPVFTEFDDEPGEAGAVARRVRELLDGGVPASEIAVLYRVNAQSEVFEQALAEVGVPYQVRGGERFFQRPEVRQAVLALRSASTGGRYAAALGDGSGRGPGGDARSGAGLGAGPGAAPTSIAAHRASPLSAGPSAGGFSAAGLPADASTPAGGSRSTAHPVPDAASGADAAHPRRPGAASATPPAPTTASPAPSPSSELPGLVRRVLAGVGLTDEPPAGGGAQRERWESLLALVELAEEFASAVPDADLRAFVTELDVRAEAQHPPTVEGVTLASLHAAKGLEWDAVFLVGLVDGTVPIQHADGDEAAVEEERRLLYVGVTRAREHLWLSWALSRAAGGRRYRRRSRFLHALVPEGHPASRVAAAPREPVQRKPRPECRVCGSALIDSRAVKLGRCSSCPSDVDEELLVKLRRWRAGRARELKVPPYVVFTDATLLAIAEQRPEDVAGLVSIAGIGASKLTRYGDDVLALVLGKH
nr:ATP-dependent DNA helicase UvrD2 [Actinosynnema pretiosum]